MDISQIKARLKDMAQKSPEWLKQKTEMLKNYPYKETKAKLIKKAKSFRLKKAVKYMRKLSKKMSDSWKTVLMCIGCFLFFYYVCGGFIIHKIDVKNGYIPSKTLTQKSEMVNAMVFLIKREVDETMWTPNLPMAFPAAVLDNMPNFQAGIIFAVRDTAKQMLNFNEQTPKQKEDIIKAVEFLKYPPHIWLMSKKSAFSLAPSSNAQYRKARKELMKYNENGIFIADDADFEKYLEQLQKSLLRLTQKNENQVLEHSVDWVDFSGDDLFYKHKGYSFGALQIANSAGFDYKATILKNDAYSEWTHLISALKKASEYKPLIVRNAKVDSMFGANHLMVQSYYLAKATAYANKILVKIKENKCL